MKLSDNAQQILESRYLMDGEDWEKLCLRVASTIASVENDKKYKDEFFDMIYNMLFLPGGRILRNAGRPQGNLGNCFFVPIDDSIESIGEFMKQCLILWASGGGTGCIRKGAFVYTDCGFCKIQNVKIDDLILSYNSTSNKTEYQKVTNVHQIFVENIDNIKITFHDKSWTLLSNWHPTMIFEDGILKYKRADELNINDFVYSVSPQNTILKGKNLDKNIAWALGAYLGDGTAYEDKSFRGKQVRKNKYKGLGLDRIAYCLKFFKDDPNVVSNFCNIMNSFYGTSISPTKEKCSNMYSTATKKYSISDFLELTDWQISNKGLTIHIPKIVLEGDVETFIAFLAGYMDTDGYININKSTVHFNSISKTILDEIKTILSCLGCYTDIRERSDQKEFSSSGIRNLHMNYDLKVKMPHSLLTLLYDNMKHHKREKINKFKEDYGWQIPLNKFIIDEFYRYRHVFKYQKDNSLYDFSYRFKRKITCKNNCINQWMLSIIDRTLNIDDKKYLQYLYQISNSIKKIIKIEKAVNDTTEFFDLTVNQNNNYFAGFGSLILIHNTSFSPLRPINSPILKKGGKSSGLVSFLEAANHLSYTIEAGGQRRSASLCSVNIAHPEIIDFMDSKLKQGKLANFNISIEITDDFLECIEKDDDWKFKFKQLEYGTIKARDLWNKIVTNMVGCGEPGLIHWDKLIKNNSYFFDPICGVNACSEANLSAYGCCLLGSLALPKFVGQGGNTNWKKLEQTIKLALRFLDDVIDCNFYTLKEIELKAFNSRRLGLGFFGLSEYLFQKELRYGGKKALVEIERVIRFIRDVAYQTNVELAIEKGTFPKFDPIPYGKASFIRKLPASLRMDVKKYGCRCVAILAIAPTGTISLLADSTSGIEPLPAKGYLRKDRVSERIYIHPLYKKFIEENQEIPEWFVDAHDISPEEHLEVQATVQRYVDNGVSKSINLPHDFTPDQLDKLLLEYIYDLKGVTVYRDGCREGQPINRLSYEEVKQYLNKGVIKEVTTLSENDVSCARGSCEI